MHPLRNILVFPCGSEIGLDIYHSVKYSSYFHLIGASSVEDHGKFVYEDYISGVPFVSSPDFIRVLRRIIQERKIDAIYPAMDSVIAFLKEREPELGCKVISSPQETTEICLSKSKTYNALQGIARVPIQFSPNSVPGYPVFIKPDVGYGSRGVALVTNAAGLKQKMSENEDLLILEYLPGDEYTVDCFTNRKGELLYAAARKRNRIKGGISVNTSFVQEQEEFIVIANKLNQRFHFRGAWFFQVKRDSNEELCVMEVASRLGGSSLLSLAIGINLALLTLFDAYDIDVTIQKNDGYHVILDRALNSRFRCDDLHFSTVYVDYDDCLILHDSVVNIELINFLYDCLNKGKRIILLTKHIGDLKSQLIHFRLYSLFDDIIHIQQDQEKADFVTLSDAIFIDDSFAEREKIRIHKGLPVFGPEMIAVLL